MSRQYNIQNRTRDKLADLNIRVSKKKSRYRTQKGIELNPLIQTVKPDQFASSKEVQAYIRSMEKFLKRETQYVQSKNDVIFERSVVERMEKEFGRVEKIKEKERKRVENLETQIKGKKLGKTVGERMSLSPDLFPLLSKAEFKLERFRSQKELEQVLKKQFKDGFYSGDFLKKKDLQYKKNFIDSLETVYGFESKKFQNYLKRMSLDDFMNVYYETTASIDIDYIYDESQAKNKLITLFQTFDYNPRNRKGA